MLISDRFDIDSFAKRHGGMKESRSRRSYEYLFDCPWCGGSRLRYNAVKGSWICWNCGKTGDQVRLVMGLEQCDDDRAIEIIADNAIPGGAVLGPLSLELLERPRGRKARVRVLPEVPWPPGVEVLDQPRPIHAAAWEYLERRGIEPSVIRAESIGYGRFGWLENYVVFPIYMDHVLVYWQARSIYDPPPGVTWRQWADETGRTKNRNLPNDGIHAEGHEVVYGYDRVRNAETVVLVEGPIDRLRVGPEFTVALLGKVADPVKIERLRRLPCRRYVIYLDADVKPEVLDMLARELHEAGEISIVVPPEGTDPGDWDRAQNAEILAQATVWNPSALHVEISA